MDGTFYYGNLRFWKIVRPNVANSRETMGAFENAHPRLFNFPKKTEFEKSLIWEQLFHFKSQLLATLMLLWHKWEGGP